MKVNFTLNNQMRFFDIEPGEYLLDTLRKHHVLSVKKGCDASSCGVCTVLVDEKPVLSCSVLTARIEGQHVTTVEGIPEVIDEFYHYFGDEGADQCGFCNAGIALTAYALKKQHDKPTDDAINQYMVGNLCRCSGYQSQFLAIKRYVGDKK